jgi:hypothetical protein
MGHPHPVTVIDENQSQRQRAGCPLHTWQQIPPGSLRSRVGMTNLLALRSVRGFRF